MQFVMEDRHFGINDWYREDDGTVWYLPPFGKWHRDDRGNVWYEPEFGYDYTDYAEPRLHVEYDSCGDTPTTRDRKLRKNAQLRTWYRFYGWERHGRGQERRNRRSDRIRTQERKLQRMCK